MPYADHFGECLGVQYLTTAMMIMRDKDFVIVFVVLDALLAYGSTPET